MTTLITAESRTDAQIVSDILMFAEEHELAFKAVVVLSTVLGYPSNETGDSPCSMFWRAKLKSGARVVSRAGEAYCNAQSALLMLEQRVKNKVR